MTDKGLAYFSELAEYHSAPDDIQTKYMRIRALLERITKDLVKEEKFEFSNLFARLNYVCDKTLFGKRNTYYINRFRIHANKVLHERYTPDKETYLHDLKSVCLALSHFYSVTIPLDLSVILPKTNDNRVKEAEQCSFIERCRFRAEKVDEAFIYGYDEENLSEEPIRIRYAIEGTNDAFNATVERIWKGCQLNLLDITVENNVYTPEWIILEPDYLIDISSLAECFRDEGHTYLNYYRSRLVTIPNTSYLLIGNIANTMLDELVNESTDRPVTYQSVMQKAFRQYPIELSACDEIDQDFNRKCREHFAHIRSVIENVMSETFGNLSNGLIEPAFLCEKLGIQGRLDFLTNDLRNIVELKSGSAHTFPPPLQIKTNNYVQTLLYYALLNANFGKDKERKIYILYSKHNVLLYAGRHKRLTQEALNMRNLIVATEFRLTTGDSLQATAELIQSLNKSNLLLNPSLPPWSAGQLAQFRAPLDTASELEQAYFNTFYAFISKELYISKAGQSDYDSNRGISSLWLSSVKEKQEAGDILIDLSITENGSDTETPFLCLAIPDLTNAFLPNFREGDVVILYERNQVDDNATRKQVFKGSIQSLSANEITIRLRYRQRNPATLPKNSRYAIEHDYLDVSHNAMFRGLYTFMQANKERRDLLLNQRPLSFDDRVQLVSQVIPSEMRDIIFHAKQANDYYLLTGPPGTGKTSLAMKYMVEEFLSEPTNNILLLSYTNRAVDEICEMLDKTAGSLPYIRISSELSCAEKHRKRLLDRVIEECSNRQQLLERIQSHRIFTGTIAALSNKTELFRLKHFQVAIIDEASQIAEPALIGLLSAKDNNGRNAIGKFILIGDHKQLPAIVLQKDTDATVSDPALNRIGLYNTKDSFFQRLYNLHKTDNASRIKGHLNRQGRMHPQIACFPNKFFYNHRLQPVPLAHQTATLSYPVFDASDPYQAIVSVNRLAFIPAERDVSDQTNKSNRFEAEIVKELVRSIYVLYQNNHYTFSPTQTIGIITPYRNQIALIKKKLGELDIPELDRITVDTVERYQGSQRDMIIYSFCMNRWYQLDLLTNTCEDEGQLIDRKLNVAITRARKQLFVTGNSALLKQNQVYKSFIEFIERQAIVSE